MINFADGYGGDDYVNLNKKAIKKIIQKILEEDPYPESSSHGGLNPEHIRDIVDYLMYVDNYESIQISIDKELDGYHLALTIDRKNKE
jgi:hypothetical protein|tara:strand:- start:125 stop:388 length:264 start_codon:yes stop_codon:yes gene_type:complete